MKAEAEEEEEEKVGEGDFLPYFLAEEPPLIQDANTKRLLFDMWGSCTPRNIQKKIRRTNCLKPLYRDLLQQMVSLCRRAGVDVFVYAGTALGVYRERGRMVAFDYDADFATLEYAGDDGTNSLSKLANFALLDESVLVTHIRSLKTQTRPDATMQIDFSNSLGPTDWMHADSHGVVRERLYSGDGSKRAKFKFTHKGLRRAAEKTGGRLKSAQVEELVNDLGNIHIDLFTLSPHPQSPENHLRVNWHKAGLYDSSSKMFLRKHVFPLQKATFEGVEVLAPADLYGYLTSEYGYLGRDAMYDAKTQCYVKIPPELRDKLPKAFQNYISAASDVQD